MNQGLLIILINVGAWLAFFIGVAIAIFRHVRRRGRIIMLSGAALIVALVATLVALANPIRSAPPMRPSPSDVILAATLTDSDNHPLVAGVNAHDGSLRWRDALAVRYNYAAPVANGVLYVEDGPTITALWLRNGARLWQMTPAPQTDIVSPLIVRGDDLIYVSVSQGAYNANMLSLITRTLAWSAPLSGYIQDLQHPAFVASADSLFVGSEDGAVSALRLNDGQLAWTRQLPQLAGYPPTVWVAPGADLVYAYGYNGQIFALRQTDGALIWREPAGLKSAGPESLTATATSLYVCGNLSDDAGATLVSLDPATGAIRWQRAVACRYSSLVEDNGVIYQFGAALTALRVSDGVTLWSATTQTSDLGFTSVQVDNGVVFAAATIIYPRSFVTCGNWWSGGPLFCHSQTFIAALDGATGARYWQTTIDSYPRLLSGTSLQ